MTKTTKEEHMEFEKWARERREFLKEERSRCEAPLFKRI